jgi:hypothetical protein
MRDRFKSCLGDTGKKDAEGRQSDAGLMSSEQAGDALIFIDMVNLCVCACMHVCIYMPEAPDGRGFVRVPSGCYYTN